VIILARYALAGELRTFWYWFYTYNKTVYMAPYRLNPIGLELNQFFRDNPWLWLVTALVCILGVRPVLAMSSFPRGFWKAIASSGLELTTSLLVLAAFVGVASPRRYWAPYWHLLYPFLAMAIGVRIALFFEGEGRPFRARLASHILLGAALIWWVGYAWNLRQGDLEKVRRAGGWQAASPEGLCDFFDHHSGPNDSIFVWGFDGDWYVTCHRHPATRFTYLTLVAGTVPPVWTDPHPEWIARDARKHLMEDLDKNKPKVILDAPYNMHNISLQVVPELVAYLDKNYCPVPPVTSKNGRRAAAWVIRQGDSCAPPTE
jgi:hypothetical protein